VDSCRPESKKKEDEKKQSRQIGKRAGILPPGGTSSRHNPKNGELVSIEERTNQAEIAPPKNFKTTANQNWRKETVPNPGVRGKFLEDLIGAWKPRGNLGKREKREVGDSSLAGDVLEGHQEKKLFQETPSSLRRCQKKLKLQENRHSALNY